MTMRLHRGVVGIAGCGGLGSNVAMMLTRAGIGHLVLADYDQVELSNLNRQHYFQNDIGKAKATALAAHLYAINPNISLTLIDDIIGPDNLAQHFGGVDILVEAFDRAETKHWLIKEWSQLFPEKYLVVGNGISGYGNTVAVEVVKTGKLIFCGDFVTEMEIGLSSPKVMLVAATQANSVVELLMEAGREEHKE